MPGKNPLEKFTHAAFGVVRHPVGTAVRTVETVGKTAVSVTVATAGAVLQRTRPARPSQTGLRPVPEVNEPGLPPESVRTSAPSPAPTPPPRPAPVTVTKTKKPVARPAAPATPTSTGEPAVPLAKKTPAKKAPAKKTAAAKAPAAKAPAAKTAAAKTAPAKAPAAKAPAKKAAAQQTPTPADVAGVVEAAVAENPGKTGATPATTPEKKAAAKKTISTD